MTTTTETIRMRSSTELRRFDDVFQLLPHLDSPTPIVRLRSSPAQTYLKLEWMGPFGSVKDRTARFLIEGLKRRGLIEGKTILEASSGNTAIGLAALAVQQGHDVVVTIPEGVPESKKVILRMLGAEVWETPDDLCPVDHPKDGAIALARSLLASDGRFVLADQYENEDNVRAHYEGTGPEVWRQTDGAIRCFVAGLGTTGTVTGVGRFLKERDPDIRVIGVEPQTGHRIPGLKSFAEAREPGIADWSVVDEIVRVDDEPAYAATKRLWREEALMVGPSTGAVVAALEQLTLHPSDVTVGISADSGVKYTDYFADVLGEEGRPQI